MFKFNEIDKVIEPGRVMLFTVLCFHDHLQQGKISNNYRPLKVPLVRQSTEFFI